jgi:tetratricopeptide (TPR) repeat protein
MRFCLKLSSCIFVLIFLPGISAGSELRTDIFPGECSPEISYAILRAYDHALSREYDDARRICEDMEIRFPFHPAGSAGLMTLYQVMMLENDDYSYDEELKAAAVRNQAAIEKFLQTAPRNSWYYTLCGASWGIQGIYYLRQDEYWAAFIRGLRALRFINKAVEIDPENREARMGLGVYLYYRSAYSYFIPVFFPDRREEGIREVERAGEEREYLHEVSRIALYYIYLNEKDYDKSVAYMEALIAERPEFVVFYQLAGRAVFEKGDYEAAIRYYESIHEIDPSLYLPLFKLGQCYFKLGQDDKAKAYLERFLETARNPRGDYIKSARDYLHQINKSSIE